VERPAKPGTNKPLTNTHAHHRTTLCLAWLTTIVVILTDSPGLGVTQYTDKEDMKGVIFPDVKSHAIQPGLQEITKQVDQRPATYMHNKNIVLMGLTDLPGWRDGGHSQIGETVKEEQHLSALNVAVKRYKIFRS